MAGSEPQAVFDIEPDEARLGAEVVVEYGAGGFVTHTRVVAWLKSRGMPNELPRPQAEPR
jgi:predicted transcriptional regulator